MQTILIVFGLAALSLSWLLPGHYFPWVTYQQQWLAAFGVLLIGISTICRIKNRSIDLPWFAVVICCFSLVPLIQLLSGQLHFKSDGVLPAIYLAAFSMSMTVGRDLTQTFGMRWIAGLMASIGMAAIVSTFLALLQWLGTAGSIYLTDLAPGGRPYANLAQPNQLSTLLALGGISVLWVYERRLLVGWGAALLLALLGCGMVMTQSRTGWLFVAVLIIWWLYGRRRLLLRLAPYPLFIGVFLFVLAVATWGEINEFLLLASPELVAERFQKGLRLLHWLTLLDAVHQAPWLGYGWMQVSSAQQAVALLHTPSHEMLQDSHNVVIDLVVWMGVPLASIFVIATTLWAWRQITKCKEVTTWILMAAIAAILVHSLLEYPLNYTFFLLPLGLLMGSVEGLSQEKSARSWPRWMFAASCGGMALMLLWIGRECIELEESARQLRLAMAGIGIEEFAKAPPPDVVLLDAPREYQRYWLTPAREGMSEQELDWMRDVSQRNAFPPAMLRYALAAGLNGRDQEAARTLALICNLHPVKRCDEGRVSWAAAQTKYPKLRHISMPPQT